MLDITLFGPRRSVCGTRRGALDGGTAPLAMPPAAADLLSYLVVHRGLARPREEIACAFWGDLPTAQARRRLNTALWRLRQAIEPSDTPRGTYVLIEATDTLGFNADSDALIDVARFEAAVTEGRGPELGQDGAARLTDGVLLYRGDLLEGMYHDWVVRERERLLHLYLSALSRLVDWHRRTGDHDSALRYARLILDRDPLREDAHQAIIEIHGEAGRRTAALRQYEACRRLLADELGVDPLPETAAAAHAAARPDGEPRHGEDGVLSGRVEALTERLQKTQRELRDLTGALAQMLVELRELTGSVPATRR